MMQIAVVVCAAGFGKRMGLGENKQFLNLEGKPLLIHTLQRFEAMRSINDITVVAAGGEESRVQALTKQYKLSKVKRVVTGGEERQDSVYNGLLALKSVEPDIVLIHDGARPFVQTEHVERLIEAVQSHQAATLGVPVKDTIKEVQIVQDNERLVQKTLDRSKLWSVQTPQGFSYPLILNAHEQAQEKRFQATDDSVLVERLGQPVYMVLSSPHNMKLTTPEDIQMAQFLLRSRTR
jgi:2-C-methyl-D-erythritol 4-phosphate cytidylyltransferase